MPLTTVLIIVVKIYDTLLLIIEIYLKYNYNTQLRLNVNNTHIMT